MNSDGVGTGDARTPRPLMLFDGVCNLCNATVQWVLKRDKAERFYFASLQSDAALEELAKADPALDVATLPDSIVLVDEAGIHTRSTAALRIARRLGFPYTILGAAMLVPRPIRDRVYDFVARNRYQWFGRQETCTVPTPELTSRFLDADGA